MSGRCMRSAGVAFALALAAGCGVNSGDKTDRSSAERISAALDVCAEGEAPDALARNLCQNATLAGIDAQVREALVAGSEEISDAGARLMVQNQNRWREAQAVACGIVGAAPTAEQQRCLANRFRARLEEARTAVQDIGGYTFQRMELIDARPVGEEIAAALGDAAPAAVVRDIRFPRIDGEQTPQVRRFNELVAQQPQFSLDDATNETVDYSIAFAGPELISVRFNVSQDMLTAANATNTMKAVTVVMNEGRPLAASDVFRANSRWQDFITDRAVAEIARQFSDYPNFPPRRDVFETATKPHLWLIEQDGLTLLFPPLSFGGSHVDGGAEVSIPWAELRPYLNPAAPAPIRATS